MIEKVFLILLVIMALFTIQSKRLHRAVIYLCCFSLLASLIYYMLHAPDVAMAEAAISSALSTIIFLAAIRRKREFKIISCNIEPVEPETGEKQMPASTGGLIKGFCLEEELNPRIKHMDEENIHEFVEAGKCDLAVEPVDNPSYIRQGYKYIFFGRENNFLISRLKKHVENWNIHSNNKVILLTVKIKETEQ